MDLRRLQSDPVAFRDQLKIDADGRAVAFGSVCEPWQRLEFLAIDSAWRRVA